MTQKRINALIISLTTALDVEVKAAQSKRYKGEMTPVTNAKRLLGQLQKELDKRANAKKPKMVKSNLIRHIERRKQGYFSVKDVAKVCGVHTISISHHISKGRIAAPSHKLQGFHGLYYRQADVDRIVEFMARRKKHLKSPKGWYSVSDVGRLLKRDIRWHLEYKRIPHPTHVVPGFARKFYSESEAYEMKRIIEEKGWRKRKDNNGK